MNSPQLKRVLAEAARWKVDVDFVDDDRWHELCAMTGPLPGYDRPHRNLLTAPVNRGLGIFYDHDWNGSIILKKDRSETDVSMLDDTLPFGVLHELAHVIFGGSPARHEEGDDGLLAYEWSAYSRLRLTGRREWMKEYGCFCAEGFSCRWRGEPAELWPQHKPACRAVLLRISHDGAIGSNILTPAALPTYTRNLDHL